jgi:type I restriction enzyme S subunit
MRDGWFSASLGDVLKIVPGKYVAKTDYVEDGEFWIYGSNSIMGKLDRFLVEKAHVVMAAIGAYAGSVRYSAEPSWINNNAMALVPNEKVLVKYLHFWLESHLDLARVVVGTGQPYVQRPLLLKEVVQLPALPEQKRIVDLIDAVDSYIEALRAQLKSANQSRDAVLRELLTGNGDDWIVRTIGEVCNIQQGKTLAISKLSSGQYPVFGANGVVGFHHESNFDFEVTALGCRGSCGTIHYVDEPAFLANNVMALWAKDNSVLVSRYLPLALENLDLVGSGAISGQVQPQITKQGLQPVEIALPPLLEQERIVGLISSVDSNINALEGQINCSMSLRLGLLADLLGGEHEIPASYEQLIGAA